jgi:hypothetical protein
MRTRKLIASILSIFIYQNSFSQEFSSSATEWNLPSGGHVGYNDILYGYHLTANFDLSDNLTWTTQDMNGDQKPDLVITSQDYYSFDVNNNQHWKVYLNTGSGFAATPIEWSLPAGGHVGNNDILYGYHLTTNFDLSDNLTWTTQDMNGDQKPDLVVTSQDYYSFDVNNNQHWKVYLNTGSGFATTPIEWSLPAGGHVGNNDILYGYHLTANFDLSDNLTWTTQDMNGDLKPDLVVTSQDYYSFDVNNSQHWKVYLNTGSGFATTPIEWSLPDGGHVGYNDILYGYHLTTNFDLSDNLTWTTQDMNGDLKPDLVVTSQDYYSFDVNNNQHWKVYLNSGSGFATTPIEWSLPAGGAVGYNDILYGFNITTSFDFNDDVTWTTQDMNGDQKPDLVVTSKDYYSFDVNDNQHWRVYLNTSSTLGTTDLNSDRNLKIFPNPTENSINIKLSASSISDIIVYNSLGQLVHRSNNVQTDNYQFDLSSLNNGVYFVQVRVDNKYVKNAKILKQ